MCPDLQLECTNNGARMGLLMKLQLTQGSCFLNRNKGQHSCQSAIPHANFWSHEGGLFCRLPSGKIAVELLAAPLQCESSSLQNQTSQR